MKTFHKSQLSLIIPLLLSACSGGGSFEPNVIVNDDDPAPPKAKQEYQPQVFPETGSAESNHESVNTVHHLGYSLDIRQRNLARYKKEGDNVVALGLDQDGKPIEVEINVAIDAGKILPILVEDIPEDTRFQYVRLGVKNGKSVYITEGELGKETTRFDGKSGTLYFKGDNTAKALPIKGKIHYQGHWVFLTDIKRDRLASGSFFSSEPENWSGSNFSEDMKTDKGQTVSTANFDIDFYNKTLEGKLISHPRIAQAGKTEIERYTINGKIHGNRFSGKAKATNRDDLYLYADSNAVEGGFYGDKAEELAGSFLTDNKSAFVAFGAKRGDGAVETETLMDALRINADQKEDFAKFNLNNFGNINELIIDGQAISLLRTGTGFTEEKTVTLPSGDSVTVSVCCGNLNSVKFGVINHQSARYQPIEEEEELNPIEEENEDTVDLDDESHEERDTESETADSSSNVEESDDENAANEDSENQAGNTNRHLKPEDELRYTPFGKSVFIQGIRTPNRDMPQSGIFDYSGSWQGYFTDKNKPTLSVTPQDKIDSGTRANFKVDFANKTVIGKLYKQGDVSNHPAIHIDATIEGNGFKGTAKTSENGIYLDTGNTLGNSAIHFNTETTAGFYGKNASELGGAIYSHTPKVAVVYGAKQVEKK